MQTKYYSRTKMVNMKTAATLVLATLAIGFMCFSLCFAQTTVTEEIGNASTTGMESIGNGVRGQYARASSIVVGYTGTITKVGVNVATPAGNIMTAIYADSSGSPGALLAYSNPTAAVSGWNDLTLNMPVAVTGGTTYWLAFNNDDDNVDTYRDPNGSHVYVSQTFGSFPDPFGTPAGTRPFTQHMRITYATTPPPVPIPEGLTIGVMILLSSIAVLISLQCSRKRFKL
ncbi:MAG: choice-of-anchor R domain-containing protein [Candidatus Bathyarchaeia archaeon]